MIISLSLLPWQHFTNERITVSFRRREISCHSVPNPFREKQTPITSAYFSTHKKLWVCDQMFRSESPNTLLKFCIECNIEWLNLARCAWRCKPQCRLALLRQNGRYSVCCLSLVRIISYYFSIWKKELALALFPSFCFPKVTSPRK